VANIIQADKLTKVFGSNGNAVHALRGVDLQVARGEFVALIGPSGSGKSTLMAILGCLDSPSAGTYALDGERVESLTGAALARIRNEKIGFVFQNFNLLARTSALDNVALPLLYSRHSHKGARDKAKECLAKVGLAHREAHQPTELSGGQQQRVAIARALINDPHIILADEPTGALDSHTTDEIIQLFEQLNATGITVIIVTHEPDIAKRAHRRITFRDGEIVSDLS